MKIFSKCFSFSIFLLCFSVLSSISYAALPTYKLIDLGLQESDQSEALAVNDNGQVAGAYWLFGKKHYFIWTEEGGVNLIDLPETATIVALNNRGQIAGNYQDVTAKERGYFWDPRYGMCDIGTLGGSFTHICDMNDLGQVVGESESSLISLVDGKNEVHAFLWQCCCMTDLGALMGDLGLVGDRSKATRINNKEQIIGMSIYPIAHKGKIKRSEKRAVVWENGKIEEFNSTFDGEIDLISINDSGLVVCLINAIRSPYYPSTSSSGHYVIDILSKSIWNLSGAGHVTRAEINSLGSVITNHKLYMFQPVLHDNSTCPSVTDRFDIWADVFNKAKSGVWGDFVEARGINNRNWIICTAKNVYEETHAILLRPIE